MPQDPRPDADLEREAVQDVARLMLSWSGRLGPTSRLAGDLEENALMALRLLRDRER